jgi:DNA-binding GntR family transcriptional regulator
MLQEEGLVGAEPDQRGYVKGFDPQELDELYANRILLETLAVRLTLTRQTRDPRELIQPELIEAKLDDLDEKRRAKSEEWHLAHHAFHLTLSSGCGDPMKRLLASLATQAERFVRIRQLTASSSFRAAGTEHKAIAAAFCDNQPDLAVNLLANHLANTAFAVLADLAGHHEPMAVREALSVARGGAGLSELAEQSAPSLAPDAVTGATSADAFVSIAQGPFKDHGEIL